MIRRVNIGLALVLLLTLGIWSGVALANRHIPSAIASAHAASSPSIDWVHASDVDLTLAGVFLTARKKGVGPAMDSLAALSASDSSIRVLSPTMLHHVAHSLGWFAVEHRGNDPHVIAECRVGYAAGCYHGVMEGYFSAHPALDSSSLANLCASIVPRSPALAIRECAHGMGHGLISVPGYTIARALKGCGYLSTPILQRECFDGVFMATVGSPEGGEMAGMPGMSMPTAHSHAGSGDGGDATCNHFAARYQGACWVYRPVVFIAESGGNLHRALRACDAAPIVARGDCYYGLGKQGSGELVADAARVADACRSGNPTYASDCRAGAVAYYTDVTWKADGAVAFCKALPDAEKPDCYRSLGDDMRPMQPDSASLERECAKSEPRFVTVCIGGSRHKS